MRKIYMPFIAALTLAAAQVQAQTILEEDFETGATQSQSSPLTRGTGWTTVNSYSGTNYRYNWFNEYRDPEGQAGPTISGAGCAACDGPVTASGTVDGSGPREEILLSPELDLNDTYQLTFSWIVSPMNAQDNARYDLQVRVVTGDNLSTAETVFSIQNEQMLRESGVTVFPITTWDLHTSKVDLSDFKGEKVKLAFVYKMFTNSANVAWIDDISVKKFTPATGPVAQLSTDRYNFGNVYIGEKLYSEVFTLTNAGKNGLQITGMDLPQGIGTTLQTEGLNLRAYDKVNFQLYYEAQMTSPATGDAVIHTTGGDVKISFTANKTLVPDGYWLETFNGYFPPAGWTNRGFTGTNIAVEGDMSAYASGDLSDTWLRSPMLDLTDGGKLIFTFYDEYSDYSDSGYAPDQDPQVQVSHDGTTWTTVWTRDYNEQLNQLLTVEVDLPAGGEGESYVRWLYPAVGYDEDEGAYDHSSFTLDRVLLPNLVGADGVPGRATLVSPVTAAENVYPVDVELKWAPAQFAKGYKVYVGTNSSADDLINGEDVGNALTFTIQQRLAYETTYRWKIVPYNDKGDCPNPLTWRFTTQADATVMEFPWKETFDACISDVPMGWLSTTDNEYVNRRWSPNSIYGYSGVCLFTSWMNAGRQATLTSPEFTLPAEGQSMSISFYWGDEHPSDLMKDNTGLLVKQNVPGGNGSSEIAFEIGCDGQWTEAAYLSEDYATDGKKYWRLETVDLDEYAGKTVQFRWINRALSSKHDGASIDEIVINGTIADGVAFNYELWDAGRVNYKKGNTSGELLTIRNAGKSDLKVKSATFDTDFFTTSIAVGDELKKGEGKPFSINFKANEAEKTVEDKLTITFENDVTATFPVKGETLAEDVLYYTFEMNPLEYDWKQDFTQIDVDKKVNNELGYYETVVENDGTRYAFTQVTHYNDNLTAHTGKGSIAASAPYDNSAADDWLISKKLNVEAGATFDFYARNLGTTNSVFVGDNDLHRVEVLVSEAGNTTTSDFKTVMADTEMSYLGENEWHHFSVDLSAYVGKSIYVAVHHSTVSANAMAFFDDLTFTHVSAVAGANAIETLAAVKDNAQLTVYTIDGMKVAEGFGRQVVQSLGKGLFVVKVTDGEQTSTMRVVRK